MTEYYQRLSRAIAALPHSTLAVREAIYEAAEKALLNALQTAEPPARQSVIDNEQAQFTAAVERIEKEFYSRGGFSAVPSGAFRVPVPQTPYRPSPSLARARAEEAPNVPSPPPPVETPKPAAPPFPKEPPMSRLDEMNKILRKLQSDSPGVEASALISEDGLMIASALTPNFDETRVAGMTATLLNLGTRAAVELGRGEVKEVIIRGENGYAVMIDAGRGTLLLTLANETAKLGLIFFDMSEAIRGLKKVL